MKKRSTALIFLLIFAGMQSCIMAMEEGQENTVQEDNVNCFDLLPNEMVEQIAFRLIDSGVKEITSKELSENEKILFKDCQSLLVTCKRFAGKSDSGFFLKQQMFNYMLDRHCAFAEAKGLLTPLTKLFVASKFKLSAWCNNWIENNQEVIDAFLAKKASECWRINGDLSIPEYMNNYSSIRTLQVRLLCCGYQPDAELLYDHKVEMIGLIRHLNREKEFRRGLLALVFSDDNKLTSEYLIDKYDTLDAFGAPAKLEQFLKKLLGKKRKRD